MDNQFDFGFGLVSAHKHVNGGGWVADTAIVDDSAFIGPQAWVYGEARVSPIYITGFEYPITVRDNTVQVGCQPIFPRDLSITLLPEAHCPRLREAAPELIVVALAHFKRCARVAQ